MCSGFLRCFSRCGGRENDARDFRRELPRHTPRHRTTEPGHGILRSRPYTAFDYHLSNPPTPATHTSRQNFCRRPNFASADQLNHLLASSRTAVNTGVSDRSETDTMYSTMQYTPLANYSVRSNATVSPFQFTPMVTTPSYQCTQTLHHGVQCVPTYPCNASTTPAVIPGMFTPSLFAIPLLSNQSAQVRPAALNANRASPWVPHPQPHPYIPAASFWTTGMVGGAPILVPTTPLDPRTAIQLTGGWPLPGTAVGWTPVWPPSHTPAPDRISRGVCLCPWLIPNPGDPNTPHVVWDISTSPMTALRITGRNVILSLRDKFGEQATYPATDKLLIYCPLMQDYWGPIVVKSSNIVLEDVLYAIYEYFQTPLTRAEYDYLCDLNPGNQQKLHDALWQRSLTSGNLTGFDISQGLKRVDCLGDNKVFWGLWVTYNFDNTFHLNVGLQPRKRG